MGIRLVLYGTRRIEYLHMMSQYSLIPRLSTAKSGNGASHSRCGSTAHSIILEYSRTTQSHSQTPIAEIESWKLSHWNVVRRVNVASFLGSPLVQR